VARAGGSGYGGGKVATRVWGERRGRWRRDREEREVLERERERGERGREALRLLLS
jgi:hypothetical protein